MSPPDPSIIATHYGASRDRLTELLSEPVTGWATPVPACPGWTVHDVVAHLVGVIEDAAAGRLSGPPNEEQTAAQVDRHRGDDPEMLLATWDRLAPGFELGIVESAAWPALFDVLSHEHDLRGALDRPGARDVEGVQLAADLLLRWCRTTVPVEVHLDGRLDSARTVVVRGRDTGDAPALGLSTTSFEVLRFRLGRRSPRQVAALPWTGDPGPVLAELFTFGPAEHDLVE